MTGPGGLGTGVERLDFFSGDDDECGCAIRGSHVGGLVRYTDYAALEAECARLRGKIEEVRALRQYSDEEAGCCSTDKTPTWAMLSDLLAILDRA